jgi:hypothetical protein
VRVVALKFALPSPKRNPQGFVRGPRQARVMDPQELELQAAVFRRLLDHLDRRDDVQNIDLMITAGFCRNCLADWYREAAQARGIDISKDAARERIYGEPFADWKAKYQKDATPEQLAAFEVAQGKHSS